LHVDLLGNKLPPEWWQKWDARTKYFNGEAVRIDDDYGIGSLAERFDESVMAFKPKEWMTIEQVKKIKMDERGSFFQNSASSSGRRWHRTRRLVIP
jgi:hypothetical protein